MSPQHRDRFDALLEEVIDQLPNAIRELIDQVPVIVLDRPTAAMLRDLGIDPADEEGAASLCGLHSGTADTERSVEHSGLMPSNIHLFREGIVELAGGWNAERADDEIWEEIMVTLLHEVGHQFGLDEDDLEKLGYE